MSVAEAPVLPLFGEITIEQMRDEAVMRLILGVVRDACKHSKGRFTVESVANGLADRSMSLFGVVRPPTANLEAVVVTQIKDGVFEILVAGPDFEDVANFMDVLEKFARIGRCERMQIYGPTFFRNHLPAGWFAREVRYERLLSDAG
jgi:hypothetical protein